MQGSLKAIPRIALLREKARLTQLELSHRIGVTENTIQNWEKGRVGVEQIERVIKLCKVLDCKPEDLIECIPDAETVKPKAEGQLAKLRQLLHTDEPARKSPIALLREEAGLTQLELSRRIGVTENTIQNWEKGRIGVEQIERVIKLCKVLDCKPEDLIECIADAETLKPKAEGQLAKLRQRLNTEKPAQNKTLKTTID